MALTVLAVAIVLATLVTTYVAICHRLARSDQLFPHKRRGPAALLRDAETSVHARARRG
jgi:hypothetical protein